MKHKNVIYTGLAFALIAPMALLGYGCGKAKPTGAKVNAKEVYTISAISGMKYLSAENTNLGKSGFSLRANAAVARPDTLSEGDVKAINNYANIFESLLLNDEELVNSSEVAAGDQYYGVYKTKITTNLPSTGAQNEAFTLYYNELDSQTETEIDDEDGEVEVEIRSKITGVGIYATEVFDISGTREVEQEGDEFETSIEFTTKSKQNPTDYVTISQSVENDEVEFEYKIFKDGKLVSKSEFEFETEGGKSELEIEFKDNTSGNTNKRKYKISKKDNSTNELEVSFKNGNMNEKFAITLGETENIFTYNNGFSEPVLN